MIGGYMGLFLGYSMLCNPSWTMKIYNRTKKITGKRVRLISRSLRRSSRGGSKRTKKSTSIKSGVFNIEKYPNVNIPVSEIITLSRHSDLEKDMILPRLREIETKLEMILYET